MKIQTFSVVVGGSSCNAKCPYCVSKLTGCKQGIEDGQKPMEINKRNFDKACRFAQMSEVSTVLLTGKGEPLVYHRHITRYLEMLEKWDFPFIELQTNGILFNSISDNLLKDWYAAGLTTVSLSCVNWVAAQNEEIYGEPIYLRENIEKLHKLGFSIRISCVGIDGYIDTLDKVRSFTLWCKYEGVEQFTWRPVGNITVENDDEVQQGVSEWITNNSVKVRENVKEIQQYFDNKENATTLLKLAHGAKVYDYEGQNISLNSCLTRSSDPDEIRQLIFSPDGHLRYDWILPGAIII